MTEALTHGEPVQIPYFSDEVFHAENSSCSFMRSGAQTLDRQDAKARGYRPCQRCFDD